MTRLFRITLFLTLALLLPNAPAQDYNTWGLPDGATLRLGKGRRAGSIAFSPDGTRLAVSSAIGIWIYDVRRGKEKELDLLTCHARSIQSMVYAPDAIIVASRGDDGTVELWNIVTGEQKITLEGHTDVVFAVAHSPDGNTLATGSSDETARLWDAHTGEHKTTLEGHTERVFSVTFSPDGNTVATGSFDNTVSLWDAHTGAHKTTLKGHTARVKAVVYSPDGKTIATGSRDNTVRLWDASTGSAQNDNETPHGWCLDRRVFTRWENDCDWEFGQHSAVVECLWTA